VFLKHGFPKKKKGEEEKEKNKSGLLDCTI
jgi:hypothetical protein